MDLSIKTKIKYHLIQFAGIVLKYSETNKKDYKNDVAKVKVLKNILVQKLIQAKSRLRKLKILKIHA